MFSIRSILLILGILILVASMGSATLPEDAETISLDESVQGMAPGAYYKIELADPGTLTVVLEAVPEDMITRINIMSADGTWIATQDATGPGQLMNVNAPIESPGWYWLEVLDLEGKTHDTPYAFRATFERRLFMPG